MSLPCGRHPGEDGIHVAGAVNGKAVAHFRSEAASLIAGQACAGEDKAAGEGGGLVLRGRIEQRRIQAASTAMPSTSASSGSWSITPSGSR